MIRQKRNNNSLFLPITLNSSQCTEFDLMFFMPVTSVRKKRKSKKLLMKRNKEGQHKNGRENLKKEKAKNVIRKDAINPLE